MTKVKNGAADDKGSLIEIAVNICQGADCEVSDFVIALMNKREAGAVISRQERVRLIVENALKT